MILQDGTALPGVAFISNVQPSFFSQSASIGTNDAQSSSLSPPLPPLTLAKEQQDELSLSIEMVRHAPINIVEVVEKVERDEGGTMLKPKGIISTNSRENNDLFRVSYEASGHIRMYVDPSFPSTVAYMERLFCYEREREEDDEEVEEAYIMEAKEYRSTENVVILSLDKSYRYFLDPSADVRDVFSEGDTSSSSSAMHAFRSSGNGAAMEAVLMGVKKRNDSGTTLELHVGQKVIRKVAREGAPAFGTDQKSTSRLGLRPDDPAPRGEK